ncbi:ribonucleoside reductase class II [Candidatus Pacearchaeota archaeon]|nr:ribonucleoside reductase class II [Candidatus Pacearchaeota archaeon]
MGIEKRVQTDLNLSENSLITLERRYLKKDEKGAVSERPEDMFQRVAENIASVDKTYGKSEEEVKKTTKQFYHIMSTLEFLPNSPTLMNAGRELQQLSACFVLPVEDSIESIFNAARDGALVHKSGGGTGYNFSRIRPKGDVVKSTAGVASGPVSFMYAPNVYTDVVKQGGTRRGANMGILRVDHPDVLEFIHAKSEPDEKNRDILSAIKNRTGIDEQHPYYQIIKKILVEKTQLQNFNISVALTKEFMEAVKEKKEYALVNPHTKKVVKRLDANEVFNKICESAWMNGEPGVIFLDTINEANPTPALGQIESTNPCIVGSTLISTEFGLMRMKDLVEKYPDGGIKIAFDNRVPLQNRNKDGTISLMQSLQKGICFNKITKAFSTGIKETYKLLTKSGYELICTEDHKVLTNEGWIGITELDPVKHKIFIQFGEGKFNNDYRLPFEFINEFKGGNGKSYRLNLPINWSKELGQVLGLLVGDGWIREGKNCRVGFTFSREDRNILDYLRPITNGFYGSGINEIFRENNIYHLSYHSKYFVEFFKKLGVKIAKAGEKTVPEGIFTSPREAVIGFLQGLFTADGTVHFKKGFSSYVRLTSKSKKLLKEVQIILLNLGIKSQIYNRSRNKRICFSYTTKNNKIKNYISDGICFELEISRENVLRFFKIIGFMCGKHSEKIKNFYTKGYYNTYFEEEILGIIKNGKEEVYDLTEPERLSFISNGIISLDCGEQPLLPYESCNLGSVNLGKFVKDRKIDYKGLERVVKIAVHFLDNVIDANVYPMKQIEEITKGNRKIGLGVMGFADMLIKMRVQYGSEESFQIAESIAKFVDEKAKEASQELAKERGVFPTFRNSIYDKEGENFKTDLQLRNATLTTIAPTGTISMLSDSSSGIEPLFGVTYTKTVMDGTVLSYITSQLEEILKEESLYNPEIVRQIKEKGDLKNIAEIPEEVKRIFVTAYDISGEQHVRMQAIFQRYVDNAVSKTINFNKNATVDDVKKAYARAYEQGCKGITVYRDGSRDVQVIEVKRDEKVTMEKRPKELLGITRRERVGQNKTIYVTKNFAPDDQIEKLIDLIKRKKPIEVFVNAGFFDAPLYSAMTAIAKMTSKRLQSGISIEEIAKDLEGLPGSEIGYDEGFGDRSYVNMSIPDGILKVLRDFRPPKKTLNGENKQEKQNRNEKKELCPECSSFGIVHKEGCDICENCGYSERCA